MKDTTFTHSSWWTYWKLFQPDWHGVKEVKGPLSQSHWQGDVGVDWGHLEKRRINGLLTVIAELGFWSLLCKGGTCRQKDQ